MSAATLTHAELAELRKLATAYEAWLAEHPGALQYSDERHKLSCALLGASAQLCAAAETVLVASEAATDYDFDADDALDGVIHCLGHERRDLRAEVASARAALAEYGWGVPDVSLADLVHGLGLERNQREELAERRRLALIRKPTVHRRACLVCGGGWLDGENEVHDADCLARPSAADEGMFGK